jgi:hypothetical protein
MDRIFSLQLWRSRLTGGLLYHGALAGGWKSRRGLSARSSGVLAKIMRGYPFTMTVMMAVMACAMIATPVTGFMAYDCSNASNVVEAYSLLEPAPCHASGFEHRYQRIISAEIIQQIRERTVPVFRCHVVESVFSQYCGHSSAAGVTRYMKFREPLLVSPTDCAAAKDNNGNITINGKVFSARIGSRTSHSFFVAGSLDHRHNCQTGTVTFGNAVIDYQSTQSVLEISLMEEFAKVNDMTGLIKLPGNIQAKTEDQSVMDSLLGTTVWVHKKATCPQGLTQLFRGKIRVFSNDSLSFNGAVALLEEKGQVAGLELLSSHLLCHHPAYTTHLRDIVVVVHPDNFTSITTEPFGPEQVTDYIRLESELSFLHVKTTLSNRERLRQVRLAICETRRQVADPLRGGSRQRKPLRIHGSVRKGASQYQGGGGRLHNEV